MAVFLNLSRFVACFQRHTALVDPCSTNKKVRLNILRRGLLVVPKKCPVSLKGAKGPRLRNPFLVFDAAGKHQVSIFVGYCLFII